MELSMSVDQLDISCIVFDWNKGQDGMNCNKYGSCDGGLFGFWMMGQLITLFFCASKTIVASSCLQCNIKFYVSSFFNNVYMFTKLGLVHMVM
jgi:hypothetical protein